MNNWKTTLSGIGAAVMSILAALAALPAQLGDVSTIIPEQYKADLVKAALISALILKVINSVCQKDAAPSPASGPANPASTSPAAVKAILVSFALVSLLGCATIQAYSSRATAEVQKAEAWARSPAGQTTLGAVSTAVKIAALTDSQLAPAAGAVSVALRTVETNTAPSAAQLQSAIQTVGGSPKVAALVAPIASQAIQSALDAGVPPAAAIEQTAQAADAGAAER